MNPTPKNIWIVDDHPLIGKGLEGYLRPHFFSTKTECFESIQALLASLTQNREQKLALPDIIITDLSFSGQMEGYTLLKRLSELQLLGSIISVIVFSMHAQASYINQALQLGALAYVVKSDPPSEILVAIQNVCQGRSFFSSTASIQLDQQKERPQFLSNREIEVGQLVASGMNSKSIAAKLNISTRTVESHRQNIMKKLAVHNTAQLIKTLRDLAI